MWMEGGTSFRPVVISLQIWFRCEHIDFVELHALQLHCTPFSQVKIHKQTGVGAFYLNTQFKNMDFANKGDG